MLMKKVAIPAAALLLLGMSVGVHPAVPAHAAAASYSGSVAITDWQFPVATGLGGNTTASVADQEIASPLIDSLLTFDAKGNFFPDMVTEVPSTSNGGIKVVNGNEVLTLHLKPNMMWSDGQPITDNDFLGALILDFAPEVNFTDPLDKIHTITFSGNDMVITYFGLYAPALSYGLPGQPNAGSTAIPIHYFQTKYKGTFPTQLLGSYDYNAVTAYFKSAAYKGSSFQKLINAWLNDAYISPNDVFSGPYKLSEWTPDQRIVEVPNPYYNILPPAAGHPKPAKIQFVEVSTSETALATAAGASATYSSVDEVYDFQLTDLATLYQSKYQVLTPQALFYEHLEFNQAAPGNPALADPRVREALYYGIDKQAYLTALFPGLKNWKDAALTSPLPSASAWSINSQLPQNAYNPAKAQALLKAAGYASILGGPGKQLTLNFTTTNSGARIRSATLLQQLWIAIGINVRLDFVPAYGPNGGGGGLFDSYQQGGILARHNFDIAEFAFQTSVDPDQTVQNFLPGEIGSATIPGGVNYDQIRDPKLVAFFTQGRVTLDNAARQKIYADMQRYVVDNADYIMLYNRPAITLWKGTIGNFKPNATQAGNQWNAFQWWVDPSGHQKVS